MSVCLFVCLWANIKGGYFCYSFVIYLLFNQIEFVTHSSNGVAVANLAVTSGGDTIGNK